MDNTTDSQAEWGEGILDNTTATEEGFLILETTRVLDRRPSFVTAQVLEVV